MLKRVAQGVPAMSNRWDVPAERTGTGVGVAVGAVMGGDGVGLGVPGKPSPASMGVVKRPPGPVAFPELHAAEKAIAPAAVNRWRRENRPTGIILHVPQSVLSTEFRPHQFSNIPTAYPRYMTQPRIVVVGSCMMDLVARVSRLPVAGESLIGHSFARAVGGKGCNQAVGAARLGAATMLIGKVGADAFGAEIIAYARSSGVDCRFVVEDPAVTTGVAIPLVLDNGDNTIIAIPQANFALTREDVTAAAEAIRQADIVLLQLEVAMEANRAALDIAAAAAVPVILNTAPFATMSHEELGRFDYIVANEVEAALLVSTESRRAGQVAILGGIARQAAIVTLGEGGVLVCDGATTQAAPAYTVRSVDSVGAGDAFCGAFAVALAGDMPLMEAVAFAQAAGALAVTRSGAAASLPTRDEIEVFLASHSA
jgi:ribokinase